MGSLADYEHIQVIGKGSFGIVSKIRRKADGKILVWKEVNYGHLSEREKQLIVTEVNLLREMRHPYIVRYWDRVIDKSTTRIYIVMEYCAGGDIAQLITSHRRRGILIEEKMIWKVFAHIALALKECHKHTENGVVKPILHRDIKPGNIFLDAQQNAKLGDFGLAKELGGEYRFAQTNVGTPYYMSPEMVNEMHYDERSDIWALGCLLYEMAALAPPFDASNHLTLAKKISAGKFSRIPSKYSDELFGMIRWMLNRQRSKRPRIQDLERVPEFEPYLREHSKNIHTASDNQSTNNNSNSMYSSKYRELKSLEETLHSKDENLKMKENALKRQEEKLRIRECKLQDFEDELERRERSLLKREALTPTMSRGSTCSASLTLRDNLDNLDSSSDSGTSSDRCRSCKSSSHSFCFDKALPSPSPTKHTSYTPESAPRSGRKTSSSTLTPTYEDYQRRRSVIASSSPSSSDANEFPSSILLKRWKF